MSKILKFAYKNILKNKKIIIFFVVICIFFFTFIDQYWISPDEYLYVSLGRSLAASYHGFGCLECIDTAHTPLLPFLISLGYFFLRQDDIIYYRLIPIIFSLGTIYLVYRTMTHVSRNSNAAFFSLFILFLFPGFFTFIEKVNLDIISLFFSSFVLYLLLIREKLWKVSLALVFVFLSKEYTAFFTGFVASIIIIFDSIKNEQISITKKIYKIIVNHLIIFLPLITVTAIFIIFSVLPYPRMLDNLVLETFGDNYVFYGNKLREFLSGQISDKHYVQSGNIISSIINLNIVNVMVGDNFYTKIKQIYTSCFQEADINIVALPMIITGVLVRIRSIFALCKTNYLRIRQDVIYLLYLLIIMLFNFRTASGEHGFRVIIPIIIPSIYFIYYAYLSIIRKGITQSKILFCSLFILFSYFYLQTTITTVATTKFFLNNPLALWFYSNKKIINLLIYSTTTVYILLINNFRYKYKHHLLAGLVILMCAYKVFPFAVDNYFSNNEYGHDYNLMAARPWLEHIEKQKMTVLSNTRQYQYYYYANDINFPNVEKSVLPIVRKMPREIYKNNLIGFDSNQNIVDISYLCQNNIDYIFYLYANNDGKPIFLDLQKSPFLIIVKEYYLPYNNRYNWGIYRFNNNYCLPKGMNL